MKRLAHNTGKIACLTNQVVMLYAWPRDANSVNFLKCVSSDQVLWDLSRNHDDGRRVHVCVGDAGHRIRRAWTRGDKHHADAPCSTCITLCHVDCALLMADEVMRDSIARAPELVVDVKHSTAGIAKDRVDTFKGERLDQHLSASRHSHHRVHELLLRNHL